MDKEEYDRWWALAVNNNDIFLRTLFLSIKEQLDRIEKFFSEGEKGPSGTAMITAEDQLAMEYEQGDPGAREYFKRKAVSDGEITDAMVPPAIQREGKRTPSNFSKPPEGESLIQSFEMLPKKPERESTTKDDEVEATIINETPKAYIVKREDGLVAVIAKSHLKEKYSKADVRTTLKFKADRKWAVGKLQWKEDQYDR